MKYQLNNEMWLDEGEEAVRHRNGYSIFVSNEEMEDPAVASLVLALLEEMGVA